jgi:hypothetical protein
MFNKLETIKRFNTEIITINDLVRIVKSNPQENLINQIRGVEYKSKDYNNIKLKVSAITPHGIFNSLRNEGLDKLSGYLYYDIDGFDTKEELNDTFNKLIDLGYISFVCKSVGGRGLSFLIKYDTNETPNDTFNDLYSYVRELLIKEGFNIDKSASGLVRKMIISSDKDVYFNNEVSLSIDKVSIQTYKQSLRQVKIKQERKEKNDITPNDTFLEIIPFKDLLKEINIETLYTKEIDGDYIIEEMNYYRILIPKIIKDGTKHKLYIRIINALYYINSNINKQQVYSYLFYINNMANPPMNIFELQRLTNYTCNNIERTGEIRIKPRIKRLHFNKDSKLTKKQKQSMGAKLGAKLKNNKTLELIQEARMKCASMNEVPTQRKISELTGLSIATIKRNWNKQLNDLSDLKIDKTEEIDEVQLERETKLEELISISEEDFWEGFVEPQKRYEEKDYTENDFGDSDGIEGLIETFE